jgi:hypothetical protein
MIVKTSAKTEVFRFLFRGTAADPMIAKAVRLKKEG